MIMGIKVRKKDYIIVFLIALIILVLNIIEVSEPVYIVLIRVLVLALLISLVVGTITNLIFKKMG